MHYPHLHCWRLARWDYRHICIWQTTQKKPHLTRQPTEAATELVARLRTLLQKDPLFLDPDLTLSRLARRLQVPVKDLSKAINQICGENVSRYVNRHRIAHACELLKQGQSAVSYTHLTLPTIYSV